MTLPISIEHARELARLVEHETHPELVVVGAVALGHHLPLQRTTADVDLALVLDDAIPELRPAPRRPPRRDVGRALRDVEGTERKSPGKTEACEVPRAGIEPATRGFSIPCSTN